jgi:uncharacterized membrane protein YdjX (TVP38/TMEM64 family)
MRRNRTWWLWISAVALGVGWLWLEWGTELRAGIEAVMEVLRTAGPWVFFTAMAVLPLFGFPLAPFTLAAGPVFGPQLGVGVVIAYAVAAVAVNVTLAYWIAGRTLRPVVEWALRKAGRNLPVWPAKSHWELALALRVIPGTPFFVQSYLLALARVPLGTYLLVSIGVPTAYIAATILTGDALGRGDRRTLLIGGVLCAAAGWAMHEVRLRLTKRFRDRKAAETADANEKETGGEGRDA